MEILLERFDLMVVIFFCVMAGGIVFAGALAVGQKAYRALVSQSKRRRWRKKQPESISWDITDY